jgi:UDP-N-acetylglucosamine--N-acetylmuramyl-(pentapeptide) pyrophosphoryl-undecaprenol N-acetylglucosamine transferase
MTKGLMLLSAGGTGGHLFPAEALAHELIARGWLVHLATDDRAGRFAGDFPAAKVHPVHSATIGSKNPIALARTFWALWSGVRQASKIIETVRPKAVIGFGGYPTLPPLYAATRRGVPTMIHEQNAVMGRANKALAARVQAIAGGFLPEQGGTFSEKTLTTGNPVRPAVIAASEVPYTASGEGQPFHLVVFGGSQGAQYFSQALPAAVEQLPDALRARLKITQQARPEDKDAVIAAYAGLGVPADVSPFFTDMAERIASAQMLICRSGASTVSEISVIGRPAILVPYPHALDHDQSANAAALAAKGGAEVIQQRDLSPERLSGMIADWMNDPERLAEMALAAKGTGKPNAADLLADMVEAIADRQGVQKFKGAVA